MKSPIRRICEEQGLTYGNLAVMAGISEALIRQMHYGISQRLSKRLIPIFSVLGYNHAELEAEYQAWRKHRAEELLAQVEIGKDNRKFSSIQGL